MNPSELNTVPSLKTQMSKLRQENIDMKDALQLLATVLEDKEFLGLCHKQQDLVNRLCKMGFLCTSCHGFVGSAL